MPVNRAGARPRGVARAVAGEEERLDALRVRRQREHEALLRAARRVFLARGYAQTRVEDVLRAAGVSTRAFYRFHASKDELFLELFARAHGAALVRLRATVEAADGPPARLDAYLTASVDLAYAPRYRAETRLFATVPSQLAERYADEVHGCREQLVAVVREIIAAGRATGDFPQAEPAVDAWIVHGAVAGVLTHVLTGSGGPDRARVVRRLRRLCRAALGAGAS